MLFSPAVGFAESRLKSLNSRSRSLSGMPGPWSFTAKLHSVPLAASSTVMTEPGGEYFTALLSRLSTTCWSFAASTSGRGSAVGVKTMCVRFLAASMFAQVDRFLDQLGERMALGVQLQLAGLDRRHVEQLVDHGQHRLARGVDRVDEVELVRRERADDAIAQEFRQPADRGEGVAQVVRRHAEKTVLGGVGLAQLLDQRFLLLRQQEVVQVGPDAGEDLLRLEGLGQVVHPAGGQALDDVVGFVLGRDEHHRCAVVAVA